MSENNPNQPPRAGFDPGWNDPPMFSYSAAPPSASGKSKLNLNKRVAFPLQQNQDPSVQLQQPAHSSGLPLPLTGTGRPPLDLSLPHSEPITNNPLPLPPSVFEQTGNKIETKSFENPDGLNEHDMRKFYLNIFDQKLATVKSNENNDTKEISKRIEILKLNLLENKLNQQIEYILYKIGKSIENQNINEATNLHRILVVDHLNLCSQWAPALRQLILLLEPANIAHTSSDIAHRITDQIPMMDAPCDLSTNSSKNFSKIYHI